MNTTPQSLFTSVRQLPAVACLLAMAGVTAPACLAQEEEKPASVNATLGSDGTGRIVIEAHGELPTPPLYYTAAAEAVVKVGADRIDQAIHLTIQVIQGEADKLSLGINGPGEVTSVTGPKIQSWAVRREGDARYLDLKLKTEATDLQAVIAIQSPELKLPMAVHLTHLAPGESVGFDSRVTVSYADQVDAVVTSAEGFSPLESDSGTNGFQTSTGGQITLSLNRGGAAPPPVELTSTTLEGEVHTDGQSASFQLRTTAQVSDPEAEITFLAGAAAVSQTPADAGYRLRLIHEGGREVYKLEFTREGKHSIVLDFVAKLASPGANWRQMDFTVAAGAVVPLTLRGLDEGLEFKQGQDAIVPLRDNDQWLGFLPATGRAQMLWKAARKTGEGKLFFTTTARIEARLGAGLLRQDHQIDYKVLQGELKSLSLLLHGPGDILDVQGANIIAWKVIEEAGDDGADQGVSRRLDLTLSQPITTASKIRVRSQTALDAFPVRVEGLRLDPVGAIRHSGHLRLANLGSVRLEPTDLKGLTQLAPNQFPGEASKARQVFVYRFPAAEHAFAVAADRIQPEVNVSQLVLYQLAETDRVIKAHVELDIREAPIREWDCSIPADYSIVSVTGASVADYVAATETVGGMRNLKVMFAKDLSGRQLVSLHLEKNEPAADGEWSLPRIEYPQAKSVRGDIGVIGAPGYRVAIGATDLLVEQPLSYFPKPEANLQQAFRIREPGWSATMQIELLDRSVQSDVLHLYSLSQGTVYGSALINYFVTGAPVSEWKLTAPENLGNIMIDGQDVRTWRREGDTLIVSLHQPVMGAYTLLVTFEEKPDKEQGSFKAGVVAPVDVQGERGYIQVVSPMLVELKTLSVSEDMLKLDPLELPAEFRLLSAAPPLGTWQYTDRPFDLALQVEWFQPGETAAQVVEFSEANSRVSQDGELVTDVTYYVKTRGERTLKIKLPPKPVRLWEVAVGGQPVTARQADDATLIPLPGGADPNVPVEVRLRLGKPTVNASRPVLTLPEVSAPVLKTVWNISGDPQRVLVPTGGAIEPPQPVLRPTGFTWVTRHGILSLLMIGLLTAAGIVLRDRSHILRLIGLVALGVAICAALGVALTAALDTGSPAPLRLSVPVLSADETIELHVRNTPLWRANLSWLGVLSFVAGLYGVAHSLVVKQENSAPTLRGGAGLLIAIGVLLQRDGAPWFYALLALAILVLLFLPAAAGWFRSLRMWWYDLGSKEQLPNEPHEPHDPSPGAAPASLLLGALILSSFASLSLAAAPEGYQAVDSLQQEWQVTHEEARLTASGTLKLSGAPGDRFVLLRAPATLTRFDGPGLRLTKQEVPGLGLAYIVTIPLADQSPQPEETQPEESEDDDSEEAGSEDAEPDSDNADLAEPATTQHQATFEYLLEAIAPAKSIPVLTGPAAVQEITLTYDQTGWEVTSHSAVQVESLDAAEGTTQAKVLLRPGDASLVLTPKARDTSQEETKFFVEASNLYLPGPGVVDGRHRLHVRTSQGQVTELNVSVPLGLTVSEVSGPVGAWQFDAESGQLKLQIEPAQSQPFDVLIETQRGLAPLPAEVSLAPLTVSGAQGEVGLLAVAFGPDAQPEKAEAQGMSAVNLGDFDPRLIPNKQAVLHRVYRYGADGGELTLRVASVAPEVRVTSKQVLSFGDERVVMGVNFVADITRAGLFQLSFPLPEGLEVESLTGAALHHWAELSDDDGRKIILHLSGKTLGKQSFSLSLAGTAPTEATEWRIPRFELAEATRQTGQLVVQPATGIRLRAISRQNVSEADPREMGAATQGSLAFRLLQRDWNLVLGVEKLAPWVTGQVLHEVTLREGQTRSALVANFNVQNASIRGLRVALPITDEDEIKTLRATGKIVSDLVRIDPESNVWEVQFKRRVVERIQFRIEYERRGDRPNDSESLRPAGFPDARQLSYYFSIRAGGRLEIEHDALPRGWEKADWNTLPQSLREAAGRNAPALALRAAAPAAPLQVRATRHALADALKLRVTRGVLTTVLSPTGDQLTAVDLTMEVIQRRSLTVGLPVGGQLFSIFVNDESVHSVRDGKNANAWRFHVLPGIDDHTAKVRFVYSLPGKKFNSLSVTSPQLNVPLENIEWSVIAPEGFVLTDHDGNLELLHESLQEEYDRDSYLSKISGRRHAKAENAAKLLETANKLLQAGEQKKANWALNSVANQHALDAASNEDARVQLQNLQTQQAIVGLNTRRQRVYIDNRGSEAAFADNQQLLQAAADNPILQQDAMNFRPQELSQLLRGNTSESNAVLQRIAARLVQHQRTTEPAPQAITISLPEEGSTYTFGRSVQVVENAPLELDLSFASQRNVPLWQTTLALALLAALTAAIAYGATRPREV